MANPSSSHSSEAPNISTYLLSAMEGIKHERCVVEKRNVELRIEGEARKAEFEKTMNELRQQVDAAKALASEKELSVDKVRAEYQSRIDALEIQLADEVRARKSAEEAAERAKNSAEEGKVASDKALQECKEALRIAEDSRVAAEAKATEVVAAAEEAKAQIDSAVEDYKNFEGYWDPIFACYEQGMYHMARCWMREAGQTVLSSIGEIRGLDDGEFFQRDAEKLASRNSI